MDDFRFGPVELYLVGLPGARPEPDTFRALKELIDRGTVRLLDFVLLTRGSDGELDITELGDDGEPLGLDGVPPIAAGLAGREDIEALAEAVPEGASAALVVLELAYARELAQSLAASGGEVLRTERVAAPVVNAIMDILDQEGE